MCFCTNRMYYLSRAGVRSFDTSDADRTSPNAKLTKSTEHECERELHSIKKLLCVFSALIQFRTGNILVRLNILDA